MLSASIKALRYSVDLRMHPYAVACPCKGREFCYDVAATRCIVQKEISPPLNGDAPVTALFSWPLAASLAAQAGVSISVALWAICIYRRRLDMESIQCCHSIILLQERAGTF